MTEGLTEKISGVVIPEEEITISPPCLVSSQRIEISQEEVHLPFDAAPADDGNGLVICAKATNLPATQRFKNTNQLSEKQRRHAEKCITVHPEEYKVTDESHGKHCVQCIKATLLPAVQSAIQERFSSLDDPVFISMNFIAHSRWDYNDRKYAVNDVKILANHFSCTLAHINFKVEVAIFEFRELKKIVKPRYQHFTHSSTLWKTIASKHSDKFEQILILVELILSMEWASSTVERGFSTVNRMLTNTRLSLSKDRLNNLLILSINVPKLSLDPEYEGKLIDKAVTRYLSTKRYVTKSRTVTVKCHEYNTHSEDLFLPKPKLFQNQTLLQNEDYLVVSDDDDEGDNDHSFSEDSTDSDTDVV